jgi:hypothetical protein
MGEAAAAAEGEEFANIPTLETWKDCRQVCDQYWIGFKDGQEIRVYGTMPTTGYLLVQKAAPAPAGNTDRLVIAGKIVINKAEE